MNLKFIYFDAGDVLFSGLVTKKPWFAFLNKIGIPKNKQAKFDQLYSEYENKFNLGTMQVSSFLEIAKQKLALSFPNDFNLQQAMVSEFKPISKMHNLAKLAKKSYPVGLLTNMYPNMIC